MTIVQSVRKEGRGTHFVGTDYLAAISVSRDIDFNRIESLRDFYKSVAEIQ